MWVKFAQGSQYKFQPLFGGDWLKNRLKRCYFTKTTISGGKIEKSRSCILAAIILRGINDTFCGDAKKNVAGCQLVT